MENLSDRIGRDRVTAKSLTLDLLSTCGGRAAPVGALIEAARLFEIADNALRVALARLHSDGMVVRDERGRYRLGPSAQPVHRQIIGWRSIERRLRPWTGDWIGVHIARPGGTRPVDRRSDSKRARSLHMLGFRTLATGLEIRPDNLVGGVSGARERLADLGLHSGASGAPDVCVFRLTSLDADAEISARTLWNTERLRVEYRDLTTRLERSAERLATLAPGDAMRESFELGGEGIRHLVLDPLLPEPFAPVDERRALLDTMCRYDELGRQCWSDWLGGERVDRLPAGVRAGSHDPAQTPRPDIAGRRSEPDGRMQWPEPGRKH